MCFEIIIIAMYPGPSSKFRLNSLETYFFNEGSDISRLGMRHAFLKIDEEGLGLPKQRWSRSIRSTPLPSHEFWRNSSRFFPCQPNRRGVY